MRIRYQNYLNPYARQLRKAGNLSEVLLWNELKQGKLGCRFLRQRPIGNYIVDFYCHALQLAIEIDGAASHDAKTEDDAARQEALAAAGVTMVRFQDKDVRSNLSGVIEAIRAEVGRLME